MSKGMMEKRDIIVFTWMNTVAIKDHSLVIGRS